MPRTAGTAELALAAVSARLVLRASAEVAGRLLMVAGLEAPDGINRASRTQAAAALRIGPDEWLVLIESGTSGAFATLMSAAAGHEAYALVDVSERATGLEISGPRVEDVLAAGCPLPLAIAAFPIGRATRTLLGKAEVVIWRQAEEQFHIEVARSFVPYLVAFLAQSIATEAAIVAFGQG